MNEDKPSESPESLESPESPESTESTESTGSAEWIMREITTLYNEKEAWHNMYKDASKKLASLEVENYQLRKDVEKLKK